MCGVKAHPFNEPKLYLFTGLAEALLHVACTCPPSLTWSRSPPSHVPLESSRCLLPWLLLSVTSLATTWSNMNSNRLSSEKVRHVWKRNKTWLLLSFGPNPLSQIRVRNLGWGIEGGIVLLGFPYRREKELLPPTQLKLEHHKTTWFLEPVEWFPPGLVLFDLGLFCACRHTKKCH